MSHRLLIHRAVWREVPARRHRDMQDVLRAVARLRDSGSHPQVRPLAGTYPGSYRLRVGRLRFIFIRFPAEHVIVVTTAFLKRRDSDYKQALARHEEWIHSYE